MKEWFLSTELMGLGGMPKSSSGVAQKGRRNNWLARNSAGSKKILEYHISNFHPDVKKQLIEKYITDKNEAHRLMELEAPDDKILPSVEEILENTSLTKETLEAEILKIAEEESYSLDELGTILRGIKNRFSTDSSNVVEIPNASELKPVNQMAMCPIPVYNVYAACGWGAENGAEYIIRTEFLPCQWLSRFGLTEDTAKIITCKGDSMEDTLSDGDEVLVDIREQEHPVNHGVYVVRIGKHAYIKRLKYDIMAEGYEVISDNKEEYPSFIVNGEKLKEFAVMGKVVTTVMKTVV